MKFLLAICNYSAVTMNYRGFRGFRGFKEKLSVALCLLVYNFHKEAQRSQKEKQRMVLIAEQVLFT